MLGRRLRFDSLGQIDGLGGQICPTAWFGSPERRTFPFWAFPAVTETLSAAAKTENDCVERMGFASKVGT